MAQMRGQTRLHPPHTTFEPGHRWVQVSDEGRRTHAELRPQTKFDQVGATRLDKHPSGWRCALDEVDKFNVHLVQVCDAKAVQRARLVDLVHNRAREEEENLLVNKLQLFDLNRNLGTLPQSEKSVQQIVRDIGPTNSQRNRSNKFGRGRGENRKPTFVCCTPSSPVSL